MQGGQRQAPAVETWHTEVAEASRQGRCPGTLSRGSSGGGEEGRSSSFRLPRSPSHAASCAARCPARRPRRCPRPRSSAGRGSAPALSRPSAPSRPCLLHSCPQQGAEQELVLPCDEAQVGVPRLGGQSLDPRLKGAEPPPAPRSLGCDHTQGFSPSGSLTDAHPTHSLSGPQTGTDASLSPRPRPRRTSP